MDIAKELLANIEAEPTQKAMALHAFEVAPHERALKGMLDRINIPLAAKADLWDAKKNSSINPKMHKILDLANLPTDLLDKAESHPNVLKALLMEDKPSEAKSSPKGSEKAPKAQETGNKEASAGSPAGNTAQELPHETAANALGHASNAISQIANMHPSFAGLQEQLRQMQLNHQSGHYMPIPQQQEQMQEPMQQQPQTGEEQPA